MSLLCNNKMRYNQIQWPIKWSDWIGLASVYLLMQPAAAAAKTNKQATDKLQQETGEKLLMEHNE